MIHLLEDHWIVLVQLLTYIGGAMALYFKLKNQMSITRAMVLEVKKELSALKAKMEEHEKSEAPHINCPVHQQAIDDITGRLDRIQGDIGGVREDLSTLNKTLLLIATNTNRTVIGTGL